MSELYSNYGTASDDSCGGGLGTRLGNLTTGSSLVSFPDAFKSSLGTRLHHSAVANHVYTILNIAHDGPSRYSNIARALMVPKIYMQLLYKMISDRTDLQNI